MHEITLARANYERIIHQSDECQTEKHKKGIYIIVTTPIILLFHAK